ncbi:MAG: nicotinamide mononucleotide transporter [Flavobacterium lindanitolerans]|jgi:nicotinamide mononucleotide transporter|uniref:nicotinamide riboside transporter PnuC n=1 Tax=Flavobacterium TaxID=237 RepID=UPI000961EDF9|nr:MULTISPECIES: nicotinamide riboside transporter PnuC [Flavobacterium]MBL7866921.1 nicotinamide mononucleotide transporter [Flavobacterium lindanitolerans]OJX50184.1 MAG: nicotinamide mononucleotide transporter [Flavobacterium sp. 38-13]
MIDFFLNAYKNTPVIDIILEAIVFITGILSVYFAKKENIWVYPTGIIATVITVYLLYKAGYFADMTLNIYFSVMSIYGWINWSRKKEDDYVVKISRTNTKQKIIGVLLFFLTIVVTYFVYHLFGKEIKPENYIDIFTSGLFFTGMWYMAMKKIENWTLWIIADIIAVPLYAYRGLGMLSLQYVIFTILAILAYIEWRKILNSSPQIKSE